MTQIKIDQILKWIATAILIVGTFVNAGFPELYPIGPMTLALGGVFWLMVSLIWREPALIVTNIVLTTVGIGGIVLYYIR
jgi:hypothetical protein